MLMDCFRLPMLCPRNISSHWVNNCAALSIPTNIAEGSGRDSGRARVYFYRIAKGSVYETISLLVMMGKRGVLSRETYQKNYREADEIAAILTKLADAEPLT